MMAETEPVNVRAAGEADAEALAALITHLGYPTTPEQMRARLARIGAEADYHTLAAERGGRLVGMVGVQRLWTWTEDEPSVRLLSVVVEPGERGRGTGVALLRAAEAWARAHGAARVHLTAALHREAAHGFYRRQGYEPTGYRFVRKLEEGVSASR